jgi:hypothetical protein
MARLPISATALLLALLFAGNLDATTAKKRDRVAVFEVPTTGKIVDVVYHPEFDEWWVKCREGDQICIYTYDHRSKEWARVLFVPKKSERARGTVGGDGDQEGETSPKIDVVKSDPGKQTGKGDQRAEKKWWDPLKILKSGEKLIFPPSSEGNK